MGKKPEGSYGDGRGATNKGLSQFVALPVRGVQIGGLQSQEYGYLSGHLLPSLALAGRTPV
jgi:hypothetical protein